MEVIRGAKGNAAEGSVRRSERAEGKDVLSPRETEREGERVEVR